MTKGAGLKCRNILLLVSARMEALKAQLLQAYDDRVEALELFERSVQSRIYALSADQEQSQYVDEEL